MHRKLAAACGMTVLVALGGGACRGKQETVAPAFTVRLLTSAPASGRWERAAERGLGRIAAELDADVARMRAGDAMERRRLVDDLGRARTDLVFCVGADFARIVYTEAVAYPRTRFVLLPGEERRANVAGIRFLPDGAGYVAGVVAARLGPAAAVGVVRGSGGPWLEALEEGFVTGFESVHPGADVITVTGPAGPAELASRGVGVALLAGEDVDAQLLAAARAAGVLLVATHVEMIDRAPDVVAVAVDVDVAEAMLRVAREAREGTFEGRSYSFDLGSGVLDVELNPALAAAQQPQVREALEVARSEVTAGIIEIERLGM